MTATPPPRRWGEGNGYRQVDGSVRLRRPPRTISDELRERELARITRVPENDPKFNSTGASSDPSFAPMSNGAGRRVPVRYD